MATGSVKVSFDFESAKAILKDLGESDKAIQDEMVWVGLNTETMAKQAVPVDTGRLKGSIHTEADGISTSADGTRFSQTRNPGEVLVGTNVEYAEIIHFKGGKGGKGQDFLTLSFENASQDLTRRILNKIVKK
jgi:phage gpG-like protein